MARATGNQPHTLSMLSWSKYPRRVCRSLHYCEVCGHDIVLGERYADGGYRRRAHVYCITEPAESGAPPTPETPLGANAALLAAVDRYNSDDSFGTNPDAMTTEELIEALDAWVDTVRPTPETKEPTKR